MNTCDTCKWREIETSEAIKCWAIKRNDHRLKEIFRLCLHPKMSVRSRNQEALGFHDAALGMQNESEVPIITGPKFGCVHHEPK